MTKWERFRTEWCLSYCYAVKLFVLLCDFIIWKLCVEFDDVPMSTLNYTLLSALVFSLANFVIYSHMDLDSEYIDIYKWMAILSSLIIILVTLCFYLYRLM